MTDSVPKSRFVIRYYFIAFHILILLLCARLIYLSWPDLSWNVVVQPVDARLAGFLMALALPAMLFYCCRKFRTYLRERDAEHTRLFSKNPHPMWVYDLETLQFLAVNEAAIKFYGYSEHEFLAMTIRDIRLADDVPSLIDTTDRIRLRSNPAYHWSGVWRHLLKNGAFRYVEISSHEILYKERRSQLVLAYNVTEKILQDQKLQTLNQELEMKVMSRTNDLLQLNQRLIDQNRHIKSANLELFTVSNDLKEANKKIKEQVALKNKFVSMASHEFRTPLGNISRHVASIKTRSTDSEVASRTDAILGQVGHLLSVLDDMLTIGKEEAGKLRVNLCMVGVENFINRIVDEVQQANGNTHRVIVKMHEATPAVLNSDESFLRHIFINLLGNAMKYSPKSEKVFLDIYPNKNAVCFDIRDTGLGIQKHDLDKVFEPFFRAGTAQGIAGTGLGLSIVKRAADHLNGSVTVRSEPGKGSTFKFILPVS